MARTYVMTPQQGNVTLIINTGGANNSQGGSGAEVQSLTLPITPEDIQINRPSRQAVTQTLTGAYQDHLGSGITTVTMRGHTGWRNLTTEGDGFQVIKRLRDLLGQYDKIVATDRPDRVSLMLALNLPSGWELFRVSKNVASYTRSRAQPLLYRYEIQFIVLHDFNDATGQIDPSPNFVINQGIFAPVQLVDVFNGANISADGFDTTAHGFGSGNADDIVGSQSDEVRDPRLEPQAVATNELQLTLANFTDQQYPPNKFPAGMWLYIVAANPDFFQGTVNPATYRIPSGTILRIPQIDPVDVWHLVGVGGQVTNSVVIQVPGGVNSLNDPSLFGAPFFKPRPVPNNWVPVGTWRGYNPADDPEPAVTDWLAK